MQETITMYRPTGPEELRLVQETGYKKWPPRLPNQPILYLVSNEEYATQIATQWNVKSSGVAYVTKFKVRLDFIEKYELHKVGTKEHSEWWIPSEDLEKFNENIVGLIQVIGEYR